MNNCIGIEGKKTENIFKSRQRMKCCVFKEEAEDKLMA